RHRPRLRGPRVLRVPRPDRALFGGALGRVPVAGRRGHHRARAGDGGRPSRGDRAARQTPRAGGPHARRLRGPHGIHDAAPDRGFRRARTPPRRASDLGGRRGVAAPRRDVRAEALPPAAGGGGIPGAAGHLHRGRDRRGRERPAGAGAGPRRPSVPALLRRAERRPGAGGHGDAAAAQLGHDPRACLLGRAPVYPVLIQLGGFRLHSYGLVVLAALLVALWLAGLGATRKGLDPKFVSNLGVTVILAGFIGARLAYVVGWEPELLWRDPAGVFAVWRGGLALHGGLLAGFAAGVWLSLRRRV